MSPVSGIAKSRKPAGAGDPPATSGVVGTDIIPFPFASRRPSGDPARVGLCPWCGRGDLTVRPCFRLGEFRIWSCGTCGGGTVRPLPEPEELERYYSENFRTGSEWAVRASEPGDHPDAEWITARLAETAPGARRVVEIGTGEGRLLAGLRDRGFDVLGFEPVDRFARIARDVRGLEIVEGPFDPEAAGPCDAVVIRHALEHLPDPAETIAGIRRALRPGGVLIAGVPNFRSLAARVCGGGWEWFTPPGHLHYFTADAFASLLGRLSFRIDGMFTRRGDAQNLLYALMESHLLWGPAKRRRPPEWWRAGGAPPRADASEFGRWLRVIARPVTEWACRRLGGLFRRLEGAGYGEELWCLARKP